MWLIGLFGSREISEEINWDNAVLLKVRNGRSFHSWTISLWRVCALNGLQIFQHTFFSLLVLTEAIRKTYPNWLFHSRHTGNALLNPSTQGKSFLNLPINHLQVLCCHLALYSKQTIWTWYRQKHFQAFTFVVNAKCSIYVYLLLCGLLWRKLEA